MIYVSVSTKKMTSPKKTEIYFSYFPGDVKSLSPEKSPIVMKDVKWYTHNCTVGFMVAGNSLNYSIKFCQHFLLGIYRNISKL